MSETQQFVRKRIDQTIQQPITGRLHLQKDLHSWEDVRSKRLLQMAQYNHIVLPTIMAIVYSLTYHYLKKENGGSVVIDRSLLWTTETFLFSILVLPNQVFWLIGFVGSLFPTRPFRISQQPVKRSFNRLYICLVTRGDQIEIVNRSITSMQDIYKKHSDRISLHVLTDEPNGAHFRGLFRDDVHIHEVPREYRALRAKYKARNLEWFRQNMPVCDDDWVLHLDEETILDDYAIKTCLDFMTRQTETDIGTGIIHYNSDRSAYWGNILTTLGDIGRVQQDWTRIQLQANWMHNAAMGVHGAFLLVRGAVENANTWESDILTEDYWFLLRAQQNGYRIGWIPAIGREISPATIGDYIKQRRRWFSGIRQLDHPMGRLVVFSWMWLILEPLYWFLTWHLDLSSAPKPLWFYMLMVFEMTYGKVSTCSFLLLQDWDAGYSLPRILVSQVLMATLGSLAHYMDTIAAFATLYAPDKGFYIIKKK